MTGIFNSIALAAIYIVYAAVSEEFINRRTAGRKSSVLAGVLSSLAPGSWFRPDGGEAAVTVIFAAAVLLIPPVNSISSPDISCTSALFLIAMLPLFYGYIVYGKGRMIEARRFNISLLQHLANGAVFSCLIAFYLHIGGISRMNTLLFVQQEGFSSWLMLRNPLFFIAGAVSVFAFAGFSPFGGLSEENDLPLSYEGRGTSRFLWLLVRLYRLSLFVYFADVFMGGASGVFEMLLKIGFLNTLFFLLSKLFPRMSLKENLIFDAVMLIVVFILAFFYGGPV